MNSIASKARSFLGVPFLHQGRSKAGLDCIGLVAFAVDYPIEKIPAYSRDPINGELEKALEEILGKPALIKPNIRELKAGQLAAIQYRGPVRHVGIILEHLTIKNELSLIHTDSILGEVTEHILDKKWLRRIEKIWNLEF